jgi:hypothetical protein
MAFCVLLCVCVRARACACACVWTVILTRLAVLVIAAWYLNYHLLFMKITTLFHLLAIVVCNIVIGKVLGGD